MCAENFAEFLFYDVRVHVSRAPLVKGVGVFVMPFVGQFEGCDGMNGLLKR